MKLAAVTRLFAIVIAMTTANFATVRADEPPPPAPSQLPHAVCLESSGSWSTITVQDAPGAQSRIWSRLPSGDMVFAGAGVVSPNGLVSVRIETSMYVGNLPRYLVITTISAGDIRDWLE